ncbi:aldo/keto reductase [Pseudomonas baltica]|uniref:aldo/keto reductase n=1 Tax=Pseudomonas baltica TaxID=2762576 RepID=UPI0028A17FC8|nr:aldo/keto reductase [Pseudomonas baltica]
MQYRQLGHSGLMVSQIILGTVPFGGRAEFAKCGAVDVSTAKRMFDIAFDAGVNMVDTADLYSHGLAEEVVGQALGEKRQDVLLASKGRSPVDDNPNNSGSSRYHLIRACEASLKRLRTDHLDLYQLHNWDGVTPIEETLEALTHLVNSGKIRYFGTSNFTAWQMMKTLGKAELNGLLKPITQQIYYTPESREAEYELLPLALDQSVGTLVWGPMGEGLLTGSTRRGHKPPANTRQGSDWPEPYVHDQERALDIIETLASVGEEHGVSVARVCLAWLKDRPGITSLIVGARTEEHLRDNLAAVDLQLTEAQTSRIESVTRRQPLYPYWHRFTAGIDRFDKAEQPFLAEHRKTIEARTDK